MNNRLPIYKKNGILTIEEFQKLAFSEISEDWYKKRLPPENKSFFKIAIDENNLFFCGKVNNLPNCDKDHKSGEFIEGLWEKDVAEIFIKDDQTNSYQEFNLSPTGAWWSAIFKDYRVRDYDAEKKLSLESVIVETKTEIIDSWCSILVYPRDKIGVVCDFNENSKLNATFCLYNITGNVTYISFAKYKEGVSPDFHLCKGWGNCGVVWF